MTVLKVFVAVAALWLTAVPAARADDTAPPPPAATAPPVVEQPTTPPAPVEQPTAVVAEPTQPPAPVDVSKEPADSGTVATPSQAITEPTSAPSSNPQAVDQPSLGQSQPSGPALVPSKVPAAPSTSSSPLPTSRSPGNSSAAPAAVGALGSPTGASVSAGVPQLSVNPITSDGTSLPDINSGSTAAAAPAQLTCHGHSKPNADPFMVAPFAGWTTVNSFLDHDSPDYALDGRIVLANGVTATSDQGQSSDFFPSYWSPALRQFISYDGHNGYDFGISYQPVLAVADGTVTFADWNGPTTSSGYGQMVLIDHHNGYVSLYGHLSKLEVHAGQNVQAGQEIGVSGTTGNSSGPHLHFSVFHNCQVTDPYGWIGSGDDPLTGFDGEHAGYLWLPGHDPLVLNPPPHWPVFPLGLHLSLPRLRQLARAGKRVIPPSDRLLLLDLPAPDGTVKLSAPAAVTLTESRIAREAEALSPYLRDLRSQGLIDDFQAVPAAAAVWVRGTATASQLEGLPGVASLSGVRPQDLIAAQNGLAHSVLIQVSSQQAPSLWPVGFRSSLSTWRPIATVVAGHALVSGFSQPGRQVKLTLLRHGSDAGEAESVADPQSGGFVAMLHDQFGNPVNVESGDQVVTQSAGRVCRVAVSDSTLTARSRRISGRAPADESVNVSLLDDTGDVFWHGVVSSNASGTFEVRPRITVPAGTEATASFVNEGGNEEASTARVPGIIVAPGSPEVYGWAVGHAPRLSLSRRGHVLFSQLLRPSADGSFQVHLLRGGAVLNAKPGDVITVGSKWHPRRLLVGNLRLAMQDRANSVLINGPPKAVVQVRENAVGGDATRHVNLGPTGIASTGWFGGRQQQGNSATADIVYPSGDILHTTAQIEGLVVEEGGTALRGYTSPGTTLSARLLSSTGHLLGSTVATSDDRSGAFAGKFVDRAGRLVHIAPDDRITVRENSVVRDITVPLMRLTVDARTGRADGETTFGRPRLDVIDRKGRIVESRWGRASGPFSVRLHSALALDLGVRLSVALAPDITVRRTVATFVQARPMPKTYPKPVARPRPHSTHSRKVR